MSRHEAARRDRFEAISRERRENEWKMEYVAKNDVKQEREAKEEGAAPMRRPHLGPGTGGRGGQEKYQLNA